MLSLYIRCLLGIFGDVFAVCGATEHTECLYGISFHTIAICVAYTCIEHCIGVTERGCFVEFFKGACVLLFAVEASAIGSYFESVGCDGGVVYKADALFFLYACLLIA